MILPHKKKIGMNNEVIAGREIWQPHPCSLRTMPAKREQYHPCSLRTCQQRGTPAVSRHGNNAYINHIVTPFHYLAGWPQDRTHMYVNKLPCTRGPAESNADQLLFSSHDIQTANQIVEESPTPPGISAPPRADGGEWDDQLL
jgi:hypothetical protein